VSKIRFFTNYSWGELGKAGLNETLLSTMYGKEFQFIDSMLFGQVR